jgi:hypothetical protein
MFRLIRARACTERRSLLALDKAQECHRLVSNRTDCHAYPVRLGSVFHRHDMPEKNKMGEVNETSSYRRRSGKAGKRCRIPSRHPQT